MRVLYTGQEIRKEVQRIFAKTTQRRVAVVAFIGKGALAHLPKPKGLEIYCWPRVGATSASAVKTLQDRGALVYFADRMHAKVYWAQRSGAVLASANLSDNAFGSGDLREAGVVLASNQVDIERLITSINAAPVTPESLEGLRQAEATEKTSRHGYTALGRIPTFQEWYNGRGGASWKWDYYDGFGGGVSKRAKEAVKRIDPTYVPQEYVYCKRGMLTEEDWVLRVRITSKCVMMAPEWVYVERIVLVAKRDKVYCEGYPFQAVQGRESRHCPTIPFSIDSAFKGALRRASTKFGPRRTRAQIESKPPTDAFLKRILEEL